ncbi:guanine nucleotide-binding protein subunit alpha, partial [Cladochytrium tenue]
MQCCSGNEETRLALKKSNKIDDEIRRASMVTEKSLRILILGPGDSGKSTVLKQVKLLYGTDFSRQERAAYRILLIENLLDCARRLVEGINRLGIPYADHDASSVAAHQVVAAKAPREQDEEVMRAVPEAIDLLWKDAGVQAVFARGNEIGLTDTCEFLMTNAQMICLSGYVPTNADILQCRVVTSGVNETKLTIKDTRVSFFDVGGQRQLRAKWAPYFDDVSSIIYVASISSYDQTLVEDEETNRMQDTLTLFGYIINHPLLKTISVILFLNKSDLFRKKVKTSPIEGHFPDYN